MTDFILSDVAAPVNEDFITKDTLQYGRELFEKDQASLNELLKLPVPGTYLFTAN